MTTLVWRCFGLGWTAVALALLLGTAAASAADESTDPLQAVVETAVEKGQPISAKEFNAIIAPFFDIEKSDTGAFQAAIESTDKTEAHQLLVRQEPGSQTADIVMGYATKDSIIGFLTSQDGKLRDAMRRVRGADPDFEVTDEVRKRFEVEKRVWQSWVEFEKKQTQ